MLPGQGSGKARFGNMSGLRPLRGGGAFGTLRHLQNTLQVGVWLVEGLSLCPGAELWIGHLGGCLAGRRG